MLSLRSCLLTILFVACLVLPVPSVLPVMAQPPFPQPPQGDLASVEAHWGAESATYNAVEANFAKPLDELEGSLAFFGNGCTGDTPAQDVLGKVALIQRSTRCGMAPPTFENAQQAGAVGVIYFSASVANPATLTGTAPDLHIPGVMVGAAAGEALHSQLTAGTAVTVIMTPVVPDNDPQAGTDQCVTSRMTQPVLDPVTGMREQKIVVPGVSVAVAKDGKIVYSKGYGVKHLEDGGEIDAHTVFRVGQLTQMVTAAAIMQLVDAGKVSLDDPVTKHIPELMLPAPWKAKDITIRHLLTHSSGLADEFVAEGSHDENGLETWYPEMKDKIVLAKAGAIFTMSNPGYNLLGLVVERVTKQPFYSYVTDHVLTPAGMADTTFRPEDAAANGNFAYGHSGNLRMYPDEYDNWVYQPSAGAISTPTDLVQFANILMQGGKNIISTKSADAMQASQRSDLDASATRRFGLGIFGDKFRSLDIRFVTGKVPGWGTAITLWVPEYRFAVAVLGNSDTTINDAAQCIAQQYLSPRRAWPVVNYATSPDTWDRFNGTYTIATTFGLDFTARFDKQGTAGLYTRYPSLGPQWPDFIYRNAFNNTFTVGGYSFTFYDDPDRPGKTGWVRGDISEGSASVVVGQKVGDYPDLVNMYGAGCVPLKFTPEFDVPDLKVTSFGMRAIQHLRNIPAYQDDPDANLTKNRVDITLTHPASRFVVQLSWPANPFSQSGQQGRGDVFDLYVVRDMAGDGEFTLPWDYVTGDTYNTPSRWAAVGGEIPAGRYQIWAHGRTVRAITTTLDYDIDVIFGEDLVMRNVPKSVKGGQPYTIDLCTSPNFKATDEVMNGQIEFDYGFKPRIIRVPVYWHPRPKIFMPALGREWVRP